MIDSSNPWRAVLDVLSSSHRVLLVTHAKPDGDALGTVAAMSLGLRAKGIESRVLLFNPLPDKYAFLLKENNISHFSVDTGWPRDLDVRTFDSVLILDTGTWSQLPGLQDLLAKFKGPKLVVDHHLTQEDWADVKLVVTTAAAAGEIAADLLERWGVDLDKPIASALFLAIATDTGWFQFSNTTPKTMRLAATLMEIGVDVERIYRLAWQNERPQRLALMTRALASLELLANNRLAVMSVSKSDFEMTKADGADTENLINLPLQVGSVEVSLFLTDPPEGGPLRISLRSKGGLDVAAFAHRYSGGKGGGHARAAGMKVDGDLAPARKAIVAALIGEMK
jgi:phosphoesterase RecJ-like protein